MARNGSSLLPRTGENRSRSSQKSVVGTADDEEWRLGALMTLKRLMLVAWQDRDIPESTVINIVT